MCSFQILVFNFFSLHAGVKIVIGSFLYTLHILYCIYDIPYKYNTAGKGAY